jgi:hypothetical protein
MSSDRKVLFLEVFSLIAVLMIYSSAVPSGSAIADASSRLTGTLSFSATDYVATQNLGVKITTVNRTGGSSGAASVLCKTYDNTAIAGSQYTAVSRVLTWASGDATPKNCNVPISNVTPFSGRKTFYVELSNATGAALGTSTKTTVTIYGAETASTVSLSAPTYAVAQNAGYMTIRVNRTGYAGGRATVGYATANGTAIAGADYSWQRGELRWDYGDATAKSFVIPISNAKPFMGTKRLAVAIAGATGAVSGKTTSAIITIKGNAGAAKLLWSRPTHYTNGEAIMNLAGYKIHYGNSPTTMTRVIAVANAATFEYEISNLAAGAWYFAISAYTGAAEESELSSIVSMTI